MNGLNLRKKTFARRFCFLFLWRNESRKILIQWLKKNKSNFLGNKFFRKSSQIFFRKQSLNKLPSQIFKEDFFLEVSSDISICYGFENFFLWKIKNEKKIWVFPSLYFLKFSSTKNFWTEKIFETCNQFEKKWQKNIRLENQFIFDSWIWA